MFVVVAALAVVVVWSCTRPAKYDWDLPAVENLPLCSKATKADVWCQAGGSWDQENLKRNDHGCPTAIFIAPEGNLIQCP